MGWLSNTLFIFHGLKNFTKQAFENASKSFDDSVLQRDLRGRVCLVTGANKGLGLEAATALARRGCTLLLACRSEERGRVAVEAVQAASGNKDVHLRACDLACLDSVRALARDLDAKHTRLYLLVNNAGVMAAKACAASDVAVQVHERQETAAGHEVNFATNTLGTFTLTRLLEPSLRRGGPGSRVIFVTSGGAYTEPLALHDLQAERGPFDGTVQYARNKRQQIALADRFAQRLGGDGIGCYSMHPGWADTPGVQTSIPAFHKAFHSRLRTPAQGVDTIVWLALADMEALEGGALYLDRRTQHKHMFMAGTQYDSADVDALWGRLEAMAGIDAEADADGAAEVADGCGVPGGATEEEAESCEARASSGRQEGAAGGAADGPGALEGGTGAPMDGKGSPPDR